MARQADRINWENVQSLLHKVRVRPSRPCAGRIRNEMRCDPAVTLTDGTGLRAQHMGHDGFFIRFMSWKEVEARFNHLAGRFAGAGLRAEITVVGLPEAVR